MNPERLLQIAANAIDARPVNQIGPWQICYLDGRIQCVSVRCTRVPEMIFLVVSPSDIRDGLSDRQWNQLRKSIARFGSQKKL